MPRHYNKADELKLIQLLRFRSLYPMGTSRRYYTLKKIASLLNRSTEYV